jgi:hypothetical protein
MSSENTPLAIEYIQTILNLPYWHWLRRHHLRLARVPTIAGIQHPNPTSDVLSWSPQSPIKPVELTDDDELKLSEEEDLGLGVTG